MMFKTFKSAPNACRFLFFSPELPEEALQQYLGALAAGPTLTLTNSRKGDLPANTLLPAAPEGGWPLLPPQRVFVGCGGRGAVKGRRERAAALPRTAGEGCPSHSAAMAEGIRFNATTAGHSTSARIKGG